MSHTSYEFRMTACLAALLLSFGCTEKKETEPQPEPRVEDVSQGPVHVIITAEPAKVELDRDILLTITVTAPPEIEASLPSLDDRLTGFILSGTFDREPSSQDGKTVAERNARLTPVLADEYRLAPFPIVYTDRSRSPAVTGWFPTRPIVFEMMSPADAGGAGDIETALRPVWIYPPFKTVALYSGLAILGAGAIILVWKLVRRIHRTIKLMRMSPRERALKELAALVAKDLIRRDMPKEFYLELTMIVRRYIERAHKIRAPEQTTQEFLAAAGDNPDFSGKVVEKLRNFLEAADLVKFAAHRPETDAADGATATAREYVETDSAVSGAENASATPFRPGPTASLSPQRASGEKQEKDRQRKEREV